MNGMSGIAMMAGMSGIAGMSDGGAGVGDCGGAQMIRPSGGGPVRVSAVIMSAGCLSVGHDVLYELELGGVVSCLVELNQLVKFSVHYCSCVGLL